MKGENTQRPSTAGDVGERVRRWRRERGWTQSQLAAKAGLTPGTISRIESGEVRPLGRSAAQLAEALGVEHERLLGLAGQPVLFPLPDEHRVSLVRGILGLSDEDIERSHLALRAAIQQAQTRAPVGHQRRARAKTRERGAGSLGRELPPGPDNAES